jgi:hypothetical protein
VTMNRLYIFFIAHDMGLSPNSGFTSMWQFYGENDDRQCEFGLYMMGQIIC